MFRRPPSKRSLAQTKFCLPCVMAQSPHHLGTWTDPFELPAPPVVPAPLEAAVAAISALPGAGLGPVVLEAGFPGAELSVEPVGRVTWVAVKEWNRKLPE